MIKRGAAGHPSTPSIYALEIFISAVSEGVPSEMIAPMSPRSNDHKLASKGRNPREGGIAMLPATFAHDIASIPRFRNIFTLLP